MRKIFNDLRQIVKASEISNLKLIYIGFFNPISNVFRNFKYRYFDSYC